MTRDISKLTLRDDYEFNVYVSKELNDNSQESRVLKKYINQLACIPGRLIKKGDNVTLEVSRVGIEKDIVTPFSMDNKKIYGVTWEGDTYFTISSCNFLTSEGCDSRDSSLFSFVENYSINDMCMSYQIDLNDNIFQARFCFDYIHE